MTSTLLAAALAACLSAVAATQVVAQTAPTTRTYTREERLAAIRTPPVSDAPRINGPEVYGARPGRPFAFRVAATGRDLRLEVSDLPASLTFDPDARIIRGTAPARGEYVLRIRATNALGTSERALKLVIGDVISLTPPMGWNNYNAFRMRIDDGLIRAQADAMISTGLADHGYAFINIDDGWQGKRNADGTIAGNAKFPDMKALGSYIHSRGLKYGLYSSPGHLTCAGFEGSLNHEDLDARTYADWGVDYIKYDWCFYERVFQRKRAEAMGRLVPEHAARLLEIVAERMPLFEDRARPRPPEKAGRLRELEAEFERLVASVAPDRRREIERELYIEPYALFGKSLAKVERDIVYSLCQYGMGSSAEWAASVGGNLWRTTRDITPRWTAIMGIVRQQHGLEVHARPGAWNDPDMLEIGNGHLSPDEMHMQMTQWCILASPLLIGMDLTKVDELTRSILGNDEVIAVNQDPLGRQGWRLPPEPGADAKLEVYVKPLSGGRLAVALFNRGEAEAPISVGGARLGLDRPFAIRDAWRQREVGDTATTVQATVAGRGAELMILTPKQN